MRFAVGALFAVAATVAVMQFAAADETAPVVPSTDGAYRQWTRVPMGGAHYTAVDESPCNGTTDYVRETAAGERASFGIALSSVPNGAVITGIAIAPCASRNSASGGGSSVMDVFY